MTTDFLPVSRSDMAARGWDEVDFVYIIGDAYVDHPSFGHAIISRVLEAHGFRVGIISQPDWKHKESVMTFGRPRLGFLVSSGNMDSMVNHYTVSKKRRHNDAYTPGGVFGKRPDYAAIVYCNLIRQVYKNVPVILGGIEGSLRRLAHYDYWSNSMKRSILLDSSADLVLYGMGEHSIVEVAEALDSGLDVKDITFIRGTVYKTNDISGIYDPVILPAYQDLCENKRTYAESFYIQYTNTDPFAGKTLIEPYGNKTYVVQNTACLPLSTMEMDDVYSLPYAKRPHPMYDALGGVPAIEEVRFSLVSNRGCFGGCNFCALTFHQGRIIQTRSHESIIDEAVDMTKDKHFKGYIHDVGGPTANFRHPSCQKQLKVGVCKEKQCLFPKPCKNLTVDHKDYISLLRKLRKVPGVKKVFIRSGIRYDYVNADKDQTFLKELCTYHISGQLKVAPEHVSNNVLPLLGKPSAGVYREFVQRYKKMNERLGKKQYLVPYLMSSHPGSHLEDAIMLAESVRDMGYMPEQVQDFYPTPSTLSTCMYYTGLDPRNMQPVYVPRDPHEKAMQRALIQYRNPDNYDLVKEALLRCGRSDLIGFGPECLIRPRNIRNDHGAKNGKNKHAGSKMPGKNRSNEKTGQSTKLKQKAGQHNRSNSAKSSPKSTPKSRTKNSPKRGRH